MHAGQDNGENEVFSQLASIALPYVAECMRVLLHTPESSFEAFSCDAKQQPRCGYIMCASVLSPRSCRVNCGKCSYDTIIGVFFIWRYCLGPEFWLIVGEL